MKSPFWIDPITGFYVITRFDDLRGVLLDPSNFSNDMRAGAVVVSVSITERFAHDATL